MYIYIFFFSGVAFCIGFSGFSYLGYFGGIAEASQHRERQESTWKSLAIAIVRFWCAKWPALSALLRLQAHFLICFFDCAVVHPLSHPLFVLGKSFLFCLVCSAVILFFSVLLL